MKYTLILLFLWSCFSGYAQEHFEFKITSKSASNLTGDERFKYQNYNFHLEVRDFDTSKYHSLFWIDNGKALFYKSKTGSVYSMLITDSAHIHVEIYDKTNEKLLQKDSLVFHFPYPPNFDKRWEQMPLREVLAEMENTKKLNAAVRSNFLSAYWLGKPFPATDFSDLSGNKALVSKGRNAIIDFTSLGCGPCLKEEKSLDSMSFLPFFRETDLVMVYDFLTAKAEKRFPLRHTRFKLVLDPEYYEKEILLRAVPCKFFLDKTGIVRHIELGALVIMPGGREIKKEEINPHIFNAYQSIIERINARYPLQE